MIVVAAAIAWWSLLFFAILVALVLGASVVLEVRDRLGMGGDR